MNTKNTSVNLIDTIEFFMDEAMSIFKEDFSKLSPNCSLRGCIVIDGTFTDGGRHYLQDFYGFTLAMEKLLEDPKRNILILDALSVETLLKLAKNRNPNVPLVLNYPAVRLFSKLGFGEKEDSQDIFDKPSDVIVPKAILQDASIKKFRGVVVNIIHSLGHIKDPYNPVTDYERGEQEKAAATARKNFPHLHGKTDKEIIHFIFSLEEEREEVMKGQKLDGVYCDVEGTLFINSNINEKVLSILKEYEGKGNKITLWTDGDIDALKNKLQKADISYPLKYKRDHAGAIVEIVIDDQDENTFNARTKIYAEKFIQIL